MQAGHESPVCDFIVDHCRQIAVSYSLHIVVLILYFRYNPDAGKAPGSYHHSKHGRNLSFKGATRQQNFLET